MSRKKENMGFICVSCKTKVYPLTNGSYRNHCPRCLCSLHVDDAPGDRRNSCKGVMKPVALIFKSPKGYQIVHRCVKCGVERSNRIAQNTVMPDDWERILALIQSH